MPWHKLWSRPNRLNWSCVEIKRNKAELDTESCLFAADASAKNHTPTLASHLHLQWVNQACHLNENANGPIFHMFQQARLVCIYCYNGVINNPQLTKQTDRKAAQVGLIPGWLTAGSGEDTALLYININMVKSKALTLKQKTWPYWDSFIYSERTCVAAVQHSLAAVLEGLSYPLPADPEARGDSRRFWSVFFPPYQQLFWNEADVNNYWAKCSRWEGNRWGISWVSSLVLVLFHILPPVPTTTGCGSVGAQHTVGFSSPGRLCQRSENSMRTLQMEKWEFRGKYGTPRTGLLMPFNIWWDNLRRAVGRKRNTLSRAVTFCDAPFIQPWNIHKCGYQSKSQLLFIIFIRRYTFGIGANLKVRQTGSLASGCRLKQQNSVAVQRSALLLQKQGAFLYTWSPFSE